MSVTDAPVKIAGDLQRESTPRGAAGRDETSADSSTAVVMVF